MTKSPQVSSFLRLAHPILGEPVAFEPGWASAKCGVGHPDLPSHIPVPSEKDVSVYELQCGSGEDEEDKQSTLAVLGRWARQLVDSNQHDAVLFRNLDSVIHSAEDFSLFWNGCCNHNDDDGSSWTPMEYVTITRDRPKLGGVDLVSPFPPHQILRCHNEMVYNPRPAGRIAFYCISDAEKGGETLLAYNRDHSKNISPKLQHFVKDHGGILHRREYRSKHTIIEKGNNQEGSSSQFDPMTWQDKTKATTREEAIQYFKRLGCDPVYFDPNDTLIAENIQSGFNEQGDWFNNLYPIVDSLPGKWPLGGLADGAYIPREMIERLQIDVWKAVKVLRLRPGDWLVLNNRSVQHGRLPFEESAHQKRLILTVYTE